MGGMAALNGSHINVLSSIQCFRLCGGRSNLQTQTGRGSRFGPELNYYLRSGRLQFKEWMWSARSEAAFITNDRFSNIKVAGQFHACMESNKVYLSV